MRDSGVAASTFSARLMPVVVIVDPLVSLPTGWWSPSAVTGEEPLEVTTIYPSGARRNAGSVGCGRARKSATAPSADLPGSSL
ncbi:hypothetical protein GCM10023160_05730 [Brachybacterium paraconglomeratum]